MAIMARITKAERKKIEAAVEKEFPEDLNAIVPRSSLPRYLRSLGPNDPALQQVHIARKVLARKAELEGLSFGEYIMKRHRRKTSAH